MKIRAMILSVMLAFSGSQLLAMQPVYTNIHKEQNRVSALRNDGVQVRMRFDPRTHLYSGEIMRAVADQEGARRANIILVSGAEAQQLYDYLMNLMEIE